MLDKCHNAHAGSCELLNAIKRLECVVCTCVCVCDCVHVKNFVLHYDCLQLVRGRLVLLACILKLDDLVLV